MNVIRNGNGSLVVTAWRGDAKTLLAFDLTTPADRTQLAGFTIQVKAPGKAPYFLWNKLQFKHPEVHAQVPGEPPYSSVNAPLHRFRWVHVPGSDHQGLAPKFGSYDYTVTPRYFDGQQRLAPLDPARSAKVTITLDRFAKGKLQLGFARGYCQSQAYVSRFGPKLILAPKGANLVFDTKQVAGKDSKGKSFTYLDAFTWAGYTAREQIAAILTFAHEDPKRRLDVFAYDLSEPDVMNALLDLGKEGRVRIILDNAALHVSTPKKTSPEDAFEDMFKEVAGEEAIQRGKFSRYAHDKIFIVYADTARAKPLRVLTGSTNFSLTGLYVNANHVLVFDDEKIATIYAQAFTKAWDTQEKTAAFKADPVATTTHTFNPAGVGPIDIDFSPHVAADKDKVLGRIVDRVNQESTLAAGGNVLFAVMALENPAPPGKPQPANMVYDALKNLHSSETIFTYGISDSPGKVSLYGPDSKGGVLVSGKPGQPLMPPPFEQVPGIGLGHEIHHKFVVCGFGRDDAVVFCGSSNLAEGGEQENGDNLLAIHDPDVVTVFGIEALLLVDHYNFLNRLSTKTNDKATLRDGGDNRAAAKAAAWFLGTTDAWSHPYFVEGSTRARDRVLFSAESERRPRRWTPFGRPD